MKNKILISLALALAPLSAFAQQTETMKYKRSSIYSMMVKHSDTKFASEITRAFLVMPVPDKYNNHNLTVRVFDNVKKKKSEVEDVTAFLERNHVACRLVNKWFNRDITNGACDVELIKERGNYNATLEDVKVARNNIRGLSMLEDAGLELIGNTFVMVSDITYIDRGKGSKVLGTIFRIAGAAMAVASNDNSYSTLGDTAGDLAETFKGFRVKIITHLYQLVWDPEAENTFYNNIWSDVADNNKLDITPYRDKFHLKYVGSQTSSGSNTSFLGINEDRPDLMILKACQRALDENVANLQKNFDQFKVKVPLISTEPLKAEIGKKEGITANSRFEVLEVREEDGKTTYKRVGVIKPQPSLIWDNRFMAAEERADGAKLNYTTFMKVSGSDFYPGMLIREIK